MTHKELINHIFELLNDFKQIYNVIDIVDEYVNERWILVSEKLPKKHDWYQCTLKDGRVNDYYWNGKDWLDNGKKHLFDIYEIYSPLTKEKIKAKDESVYWTDWVVAWMPMPEPWRETL